MRKEESFSAAAVGSRFVEKEEEEGEASSSLYVVEEGAFRVKSTTGVCALLLLVPSTYR